MTDIVANQNPTTNTALQVKVHEQTRSKIGKIFVRGFFIGIFGSIVLAIVYNIVIFLLTRSTELFIDLNTVIPLL